MAMAEFECLVCSKCIATAFREMVKKRALLFERHDKDRSASAKTYSKVLYAFILLPPKQVCLIDRVLRRALLAGVPVCLAL